MDLEQAHGSAEPLPFRWVERPPLRPFLPPQLRGPETPIPLQAPPVLGGGPQRTDATRPSRASSLTVLTALPGASEVARDEDDLDQRPLATANGDKTSNPENRNPKTELQEVREEKRELRRKLEKLREELRPQLDRMEQHLQDLQSGGTQELPSILTEWTKEELLIFGASRPNTSANTVNKYWDQLERMHRWGVSLWPPNPDEYRAFMAHKKEQGLSGSTLNVYKYAYELLQEFLDAKTGPEWSPVDFGGAYTHERGPIELPPNDLVPEFWAYDYFPRDPVKTRYAQYLFRFALFTGVRVPSELAVLTWDKVNFETRTIKVVQPKKGFKVNLRCNQPEHVLTARNAKSLKLYKETLWPKLDPKTDHVFPRPWNGNSWVDPHKDNPFKNLGAWMKRHGTKVWPGFWPYATRHWFATELQRQTGNIHHVARELGDTVATADETYIDRETLRSDYARTWDVPPLGQQERETGGS